MILEAHHGLQPDCSPHIWLLHFLFLDAINQDITGWIGTWNSHHLQMKGEESLSPEQRYFFSMLDDGPRGFNPDDPDDDLCGDDIATFGIDWEAMDDPQMRHHHTTHNPVEEGNPFDPNSGPQKLSEVNVESPTCPLSPDQVLWLSEQLKSSGFDLNTNNEFIRREIWVTAFELCNRLFGA